MLVVCEIEFFGRFWNNWNGWFFDFNLKTYLKLAIIEKSKNHPTIAKTLPINMTYQLNERTLQSWNYLKKC
jgi:hypothetical protein